MHSTPTLEPVSQVLRTAYSRLKNSQGMKRLNVGRLSKCSCLLLRSLLKQPLHRLPNQRISKIKFIIPARNGSVFQTTHCLPNESFSSSASRLSGIMVPELAPNQHISKIKLLLPARNLCIDFLQVVFLKRILAVYLL